jgi:exonuclease III
VGIRGDWNARRAVLRAGFDELRPDVFVLQETIVTDDYDQARDLFGEEFHVAHQTNREPDGQGVSIASRWPLRNVHELDLHVSKRTADFACTALLADINAPSGV